MANIDRIVNVQISLNTNGISKEGFSTILILGNYTSPTSVGRAVVGSVVIEEDIFHRIQTYTSINDLTDDNYGTDDPIYKAATAIFSQTPRPTMVKVGLRKEDESISEAMSAIMAADNDFYGIILADRNEENILAMAEWVETQTKLFGTATANPNAKNNESKDDLLSKLKAKNYYRTFAYYHELADTEYVEAGIMARCFAINPGGETWANKVLAGLTADGINETEYIAITDKSGNTFESVRNKSVTQNGKVAGDEWIDVIRFRDWLQEEIKTNVFNLLINSDKVPYTDVGIGLVQNQILQALLLGQRRGGIASTEYDADGNENLGFTLEMPLAANISANTKASRVLEDIKFTARLAGAIHAVKINGSFTYENLINTSA